MASYGWCADCAHEAEIIDEAGYDVRCDRCLKDWRDSDRKIKANFEHYPIPWSELRNED